MLRIGRTCAYELARVYRVTEGHDGLPVVEVASGLRVPRVALEDLIGAPITWPIPQLAESYQAASVDSVSRPTELRLPPE
ncbi:MAG: hypothetical protein AAFZ07_10995 [Actinomycetota bacterium]